MPVELMEELVTKCGNLHMLTLAHVGRVNDAFLRKVRQPRLVELSLMGCRSITSTSLTIVADQCPALQRLSLAGCPNIQREGLAVLTSRFTSLTWLRLDLPKRPASAEDLTVEELVGFVEALPPPMKRVVLRQASFAAHPDDCQRALRALLPMRRDLAIEFQHTDPLDDAMIETILATAATLAPPDGRVHPCAPRISFDKTCGLASAASRERLSAWLSGGPPV